MERLELEVSKREIIGKKVRFLRRKGTTPVNLYGCGVDSTPLQADTKHLEQAMAQAGKTDLISLKIDGLKTARNVLIREVQRKPVSNELLHIDFYEVKMTEKIKADVPLAFIGEAPALKKSNVSLLHLIDSLHIEALPDVLPHNLKVDLSNLEETDQAIYVKDLILDEGVTMLSDPEQMLVKVAESRHEAVEAEAVPTEIAEMAEEALPEVEGSPPSGE